MKKQILATLGAALVLTAAPALADPAAPPSPRPGVTRSGPRAALDALKLTPAQREKMRALRQEFRARGKAADAAERRARRQEFRTRLMALLSPEQRAQFEAARASRQKGR